MVAAGWSGGLDSRLGMSGCTLAVVEASESGFGRQAAGYGRQGRATGGRAGLRVYAAVGTVMSSPGTDPATAHQLWWPNDTVRTDGRCETRAWCMIVVDTGVVAALVLPTVVRTELAARAVRAESCSPWRELHSNVSLQRRAQHDKGLG